MDPEQQHIPANTAMVNICNKLKFQAGGWWALVFGAFLSVLTFITFIVYFYFQYQIKIKQIEHCIKCPCCQQIIDKENTVVNK